MRPWWKQVALRADKSAFDLPECAEALTVALEREFAEELRPTFVQELKHAHEEPGLFCPAESIHLQKLEAATPLERRVLDNIAVLSPAELSAVLGLVSPRRQRNEERSAALQQTDRRALPARLRNGTCPS
jgi:hypothetical protein